jgi:hypothetical protein
MDKPPKINPYNILGQGTEIIPPSGEGSEKTPEFNQHNLLGQTEIVPPSGEGSEKPSKLNFFAKKIVGKLEIAYNQFWINRHEEKAVEKKGEMEEIDAKIGALGREEEETKTKIKTLTEQGLPGVAVLQLKLKVLNAQKIELLGKKDKAQSKFEKRENKSKPYVNKRDQIANKLIEAYDQKLEPMEEVLEELQTQREEVDLLMMGIEIRHKELLGKLENIEERRKAYIETSRLSGLQAEQIKEDKVISDLEKELEEGRKKMALEQKSLEQRRNILNEKIAKADGKANPYRDKRENFVRIKNNRPIDFGVPTRKREQSSNQTESTSAHTGQESSGNVNPSRGIETGEQKDVSYLINIWIAKQKTEIRSRKFPFIASDFLKGATLKKETKINFEDFKRILTQYYRTNYKTLKLGKPILKKIEEEIKTLKKE